MCSMCVIGGTRIDVPSVVLVNSQTPQRWAPSLVPGNLRETFCLCDSRAAVELPLGL